MKPVSSPLGNPPPLPIIPSLQEEAPRCNVKLLYDSPDKPFDVCKLVVEELNVKNPLTNREAKTLCQAPSLRPELEIISREIREILLILSTSTCIIEENDIYWEANFLCAYQPTTKDAGECTSTQPPEQCPKEEEIYELDLNALLGNEAPPPSEEDLIRIATRLKDFCLKSIIFRGVAYTRKVLQTFTARQPLLQKIILGECNWLSANDLRRLSNSPLQEMQLHSVRIDGDMLRAILQGIQNLKKLSLIGCTFLPDVLTKIAHCPQLANLKKLDLSYSTITAKDLVAILKQCPQLETLNISGCTHLKPADLAKMPSLPRLRELHMSHVDNATLAQILKSTPKLERATLAGLELKRAELSSLSEAKTEHKPLPDSAVDPEALNALTEKCSHLQRLASGETASARPADFNTVADCLPNLPELSTTGQGHSCATGETWTRILGACDLLQKFSLAYCPITNDQAHALVEKHKTLFKKPS